VPPPAFSAPAAAAGSPLPATNPPFRGAPTADVADPQGSSLNTGAAAPSGVALLLPARTVNALPAQVRKSYGALLLAALLGIGALLFLTRTRPHA
jgi:hypothetical protein